jgi:hypothetical protein
VDLIEADLKDVQEELSVFKFSNSKLIADVRLMKESRESEVDRFRAERESLIREISAMRDQIAELNKKETEIQSKLAMI